MTGETNLERRGIDTHKMRVYKITLPVFYFGFIRNPSFEVLPFLSEEVRYTDQRVPFHIYYIRVFLNDSGLVYVYLTRKKEKVSVWLIQWFRKEKSVNFDKS